MNGEKVEGASAAGRAAVLGTAGLVAFWDFQDAEGAAKVADGPHAYALEPKGGFIRRTGDGLFGPHAIELEHGQWLRLPRAACPALRFGGEGAAVTVAAWVKRKDVRKPECQAIAGMWNESEKKRQYGLFLDLRIWGSGHQVCGHVSASGGPTPGHKYCMDASIGSTAVPYETWSFVAFTYDGAYARSYLNGSLDRRDGYNPYPYPDGLYDGGADGADFTVGAVHRHGEMGNFFEGTLGGLAVFDRALTEAEMARLHRAVPI
ncbi:LamG domain-containing protein [Paenibacillus antri]|uniref:LamG domain-containing protein n=1 Tax=Paenibacillus antri TaxID=2582848 RepID=A0A5R9GEX4_9BACL|nr:LamG domain-containing protein [Paenibacillus antri]TLS51774.1 LamG domain-containing protein [Paenibacillus antri]